MKYRDARLLKEGDEIIRKEDNAAMIISEAQAFGQYRTVKLICYLKSDEQKNKLTYYNDDVSAVANE